MASFAQPADLNTYTGDTWDTNQAQTALNAATAIIQKTTGQTLSAVTGDKVILNPSPDGTVMVPELPVTNVSLVEILTPDLTTGTPTWTSLDPSQYRWNTRGMVYLIQPVQTWPLQWDTVRVTYDHGYSPIPDALFDVCLSVAARLVDNPYGYNSTNVGGVSVGMGGSSGVTLRDWELVILDRFTLMELA